MFAYISVMNIHFKECKLGYNESIIVLNSDRNTIFPVLQLNTMCQDVVRYLPAVYWMHYFKDRAFNI